MICEAHQTSSTRNYSFKEISEYYTGENRCQHSSETGHDSNTCDQDNAKKHDLGIGECPFKPVG